jgi:hypothetical protein
VWGTLTEIREGDVDRLLLVTVSGRADGRDTRGPDPLRLLTRAGRLPDGTPIRPGATGLFLFCRPIDGSGEFGTIDGWLLHDGFRPMNPDPEDRSRIRRLVAESGAPDVFSAIELLESAEASCRALGLGVLRQGTDLDEASKARVARAFLRETDPTNQALFLRLFLRREWPLAGSGMPGLLLREESPDRIEVVLRYLEVHGSPADRATLLTAYPVASPRERRVLLRAYSRLGLTEARAHFMSALRSADEREVRCGITNLGGSGLTGTEAVYGALLESTDPEIRRLALKGLGSLATPTAARTLRDFVARAPADDPLNRLAEKILRQPYRYGRLRRPYLETPGDGTAR